MAKHFGTGGFLFLGGIAFAAICVALAYATGADFTPVNDCWALVTLVLYGQWSVPVVLARAFSFNMDPRFFQTVLWALYGALRTDDFLFLKLSLFALDLLSTVGVMAVLMLFYEPPLAILGAAIFLLFPFDATLVWMGGLIVLLGLFFFIWSTYFFLRYQVRGGLQNLLLACALIAAANYTYPGYILMPPAIAALYLLMRWRDWIRLVLSTAIYMGVHGLTLIGVLREMASGVGRNAGVSDLSLSGGLAGLGHAFWTIFIAAAWDAVHPAPGHFAAAAAVGLGVALTIVLAAALRGLPTSQASLAKSLPLLAFSVLAAIVLVAAGYLPFALTNLRFGVERELMFSRLGAVVFCLSLLTILWRRVRPAPIGRLALGILAWGLTTLLMSNKIAIADLYGNASHQERMFLAGMVEAIPDFDHTTTIFVRIKDEESLAQPATTLITSPRLLLQYLYDDGEVQAIGASDYFLRRFATYDAKTKTFEMLGQTARVKDLIAVSFSPATGKLEPLTSMDVGSVDGSLQSVDMPGISGVVLRPLTSRQQWFVDHR